MSLFACVLQVIGFLLQTIPFVILIIVPFSAHSFQHSKSAVILRLCITIMLLAIGFTFTISFALQTTQSNQGIRLYANIYFSLSILGIAIRYIHYIKAKLMKKLLIYVIVVHYGAFIYIISSALYRHITWLPIKELLLYDIRNNIINFTLLFLTYPFVYLFMKYKVRNTLPIIGNKAMQRGCIYMISVLLCCCIAVYALTYQTDGEIVSIFQGLVILMIILTDIIVYYMFFMEADISMDNYQLQQQVIINESQYRRITNDIEEAKRIRHDAYHHLNRIAALHLQGKEKELNDYILQYANELHQSDELIITGNVQIDAILKYYKSRAEHFQIQMLFHVDNLTNLTGYEMLDLTLLFSNALEKVIETCKLLSFSSIDVSLYLHHQTLLFQIIHPVVKDNVKNHPMLWDDDSLRYICERYKGSVTIQQKDSQHISRYVLNANS